jgi:hypothetical protein
MKALLLIMMAFFVGCGCQTGPRSYTPMADVPSSVVQVYLSAEGQLFEKKADGGVRLVGPGHERASGTGFVVGQKDVTLPDGGTSIRSLIFTCNHVGVIEAVVNPDEDHFAILKSPEINVYDIDNNQCPGTLVWASHKTNTEDDAAQITSDSDKGPPLALSPSLPPLAARIYYVGAPNSFHPSGIFAIIDGRFSGVDEEYQAAETDPKSRVLAVTLPVYPGASGSPVMYDGKVIGMVFSTDAAFHHNAYAIPGDKLVKIIDQLDGGW